MIFSQSGRIAEDLYVLGSPAVPVYLLDGPRPVLVDAGLAALGELYIAAAEGVLAGRCPVYCLLTHVHFDHCGAAAALKTRYPEMQVLAAENARRILARPGAVERIRLLNRSAISLVRKLGLAVQADPSFVPFAVDRTVRDGDRIERGDGRWVEVLETPGHTWDCLSYYVAEENLLFSSEAAGQADVTGTIVSDCLADYGQYQASLRRLQELRPQLLCPGHLFVYSGPDAERYLEQARNACTDFRDTVLARAEEESGDIVRIAQRIKAVEYDTNPGPKQPEPAYLVNLEARIQAVLRTEPGYFAPQTQ
jgi:glyoxylase-like metal-dependent hydrolase (beta-lactamase superfamily II)